jgi:hypothetical protein
MGSGSATLNGIPADLAPIQESRNAAGRSSIYHGRHACPPKPPEPGLGAAHPQPLDRRRDRAACGRLRRIRCDSGAGAGSRREGHEHADRRSLLASEPPAALLRLRSLAGSRGRRAAGADLRGAERGGTGRRRSAHVRRWPDLHAQPGAARLRQPREQRTPLHLPRWLPRHRPRARLRRLDGLPRASSRRDAGERCARHSRPRISTRT